MLRHRLVHTLCQVGKLVRPSSVQSRYFSEDGGEQETEMRSEASVNQLQLMGRVGKDPEERGTQGSTLILFPLATNSSYLRGDGVRVQRTEWHRICVGLPGLKDKVAINIRRGDRIYMSGEIRYDDYMDPSSQTKVRATSIFANSIINLTKKYLNETGETEDM